MAGCTNLGELEAEGRGAPKDVAGAVATFARSCATNVPEAQFGCFGSALAYEKERKNCLKELGERAG